MAGQQPVHRAALIEGSEIGHIQSEHPDVAFQAIILANQRVEEAQIVVGAMVDEVLRRQFFTQRNIFLGLQNPGVPDVVDVPGHRNRATAFMRDEEEPQRFFDSTRKFVVG